MLAKKFFNSQRVFIPVPATGSGYFATAAPTNKLSLYDPAGNTFSNSIYSFSTSEATRGNAAGNSVKGIFVRARGAAGNDTFKLTFATQTISAGGLLTANTTNDSGWGVGNSTKALFKVGAGVNTVNAYTYASDTASVTTGTQSNITMTSNHAIGDGTDAYVTLPVGSGTVQTDRWSYAAETRSAGTALSSNFNGSLNGGNCVGNNAVGIIVGNAINNPATCAYTYGSQTTAASSAFTGGSNDPYGPGSSDGTAGIMIATSNITRKWTFSGNVVTAGGSLPSSQTTVGAPAVSSGNPGVNI